VAAAAVLLTRDGGHSSSTPPPATGSVQLRVAGPYDPPPGDGVEDNGRLSLATDGNPATAWATEWYATPQFGSLKSGVGLVVDAGKPVRLRSLTVQSDTPGFTAVVKAGSSAHGPFSAVSQQQTVGRTTTFSLDVPSPQEYYMLWVTMLPGDSGPHFHADVNELTAG
jgi:hypothetical protein